MHDGRGAVEAHAPLERELSVGRQRAGRGGLVRLGARGDERDELVARQVREVAGHRRIPGPERRRPPHELERDVEQVVRARQLVLDEARYVRVERLAEQFPGLLARLLDRQGTEPTDGEKAARRRAPTAICPVADDERLCGVRFDAEAKAGELAVLQIVSGRAWRRRIDDALREDNT